LTERLRLTDLDADRVIGLRIEILDRVRAFRAEPLDAKA
jgi:hypothetical protein